MLTAKVAVPVATLAKHLDAELFEGADGAERTWDGVTSVTQDFERLFNDHAQFVYRTAYGVTGSHEDAEDVLQTLFSRLLPRELSAEISANPKPYLYRAAVNLSLNILQSRRRYVAIEDDDLPSLPAPAVESVDDYSHRLLNHAIGQLKPDVVRILILRYVHDKSDAEIARMLGVSRGTIALRLFRSRARLKKLLAAAGVES